MKIYAFDIENTCCEQFTHVVMISQKAIRNREDGRLIGFWFVTFL